MIEQRLMATGGWDLSLRDETPFSVYDQANESAYFGHVIVTPTRVDPNAMSSADLLALARYVGVYRNRSDDGLSLSGPGLAMWLGDEDDKGDLTVVAVSESQGHRQWVQNILDVSGSGGTSFNLGNGITEGTVGNSAAVGLGADIQLDFPPLVTARTMLDQLTDEAETEWRINPDGTLDVHLTATLWPSATTPTVVLTRGGGSRDRNIRGLPVTSWGHQGDGEDYTTGVLAAYKAGGVTDGGYVADRITPPYKRLDGSNMVMERHVDANTTTSSTRAGRIAEKQRKRTDDPRVEIAPTVDVWDLGADVQPGDTIYVYEPTLDLVDTATQLAYRGEVIFPTVKRVYATRQPIRQGNGIYLRLPDAGGTIVDLSDWVAAEEGDASLEVGSARRSLLKVQRRGAAA